MKARTTMGMQFMLLAAAFSVAAADTLGDPRYIPIQGCAWRLTLGDTKGDGKKDLIYGSFEGAVRCIDPHADGKLLWEQLVGGGFVFALAARDVTGDGRAETFAAVTDGYIHAFGPDGKLLWRFESVLPQWALDVGVPQKGGKPVVVCGGVDKKLHVLDAASGTQIAERLLLQSEGRGSVFVHWPMALELTEFVSGEGLRSIDLGKMSTNLKSGPEARGLCFAYGCFGRLDS